MGVFGKSNPVFEMLKQDHAKVKKLFDEFEKVYLVQYWITFEL